MGKFGLIEGLLIFFEEFWINFYLLCIFYIRMNEYSVIVMIMK